MLPGTEISVIWFANCLPRGYALSAGLVPSSPDVLDPVWNAHAKTLESRLFIKAMLTWWSDGSHLLDGITLLTSHKARGQSLEFSGETLPQWVLSDKPRQVSATMVPQRTPATSGPSPGQTCFFLERNLLTLTAEDPNGYFGFLNSSTGDVFLRMAPCVRGNTLPKLHT